MRQIIGLKELRENVGMYADKVKRGMSFVVVRRSKPLFKITPIDDEENWEIRQAPNGETNWETVIDFTKMRKGGVPIKDILSHL